MKYFKLIGIMSLLVFSFYLTDFVTELAINTNPLMQNIKNNSKNYCETSVNATIEQNTIIPGIKGKKVNEIESFLNMKDFGSFNSNYLIYDYIKPDISIEDNKEKIIISGNQNKRQISILIKDNLSVEVYLKEKKLKYSKLIDIDDKIDENENINIENTKEGYKDLDTLLKKKKINKEICIINYSNIELCKKNKYYLVDPNIKLKNNNFINTLNNIDNGSIILIDDMLTIENFKIFANKINNKDLKLVYLSEIIQE